MQRMSDTQKQYLQSNNNLVQTPESNLLGFNKMEMEGMSDMFAFITEDNIPHAHFDCANIGKDNMFYVANETDDKRKINGIKQKQMAQSLESERKKQDQMIKQQIDNFKDQYTR